MQYDFDQLIDRRGTSSTKWEKFKDPDVLPFWVADMDFAAPNFILQALHERIDHPILGYTDRPASLTKALQNWLEHHFGWSVPDAWVVWVPGVVPALNLAARTQAPEGSLLIPTPVYHPFLDLAKNAGLRELQVVMNENRGVWEMDWDAMADALQPDTRMLMICNPQNPTGRCYRPDEIAQLAAFIERHDLYLVSDEIHCNIVLDPACRHTPVAGAHPEIAARTISLYAATKVYNIPGISCAAAIIPDARLRQRFLDARAGTVPSVGPLGFVASEAAFNDRSDWVPQLLEYLRGNLALVQDVAGERLARLEATYLAWIRVDDLGIKDTQAHFERFGLGLSPGAQFGAPGYVRFNFGCPRTTLRTGLERLGEALSRSDY